MSGCRIGRLDMGDGLVLEFKTLGNFSVIDLGRVASGILSAEFLLELQYYFKIQFSVTIIGMGLTGRDLRLPEAINTLLLTHKREISHKLTVTSPKVDETRGPAMDILVSGGPDFEDDLH